MPNRMKTDNGEKQDGKVRRRFRGMMKSKTGRAVGISSLAAPVIGFIINDLRRPDSISRQLVSRVVKKLSGPKFREVEVIDITDEVEISESNNQKKITDN